MLTKNRVELFWVTLVIASGMLNLNLISVSSLGNPTLDREAIAKKSGGRSGGGSFKRSTPSRSPSRSYNQRKSTSSPTYKREPSPTYRDSTPVPIYQNRSRPYNNYSNRGGSGGLIFLMFFLLIAGVIIYILYKTFSQIVSHAGTANKINRERDNDRVTVSLVQVALSTAAENIQQELSELSLNTDTDTESGLVSLIQESALVLLRNSHAWTHVISRSNSLDIDLAESAFDKLSIIERSKFTGETLSNIDGTVKTREVKDSISDDLPAYVVVTLILGTADDRPLFDKINTDEHLREVLLKLSSMREGYLMKFELLWTPQSENQYLTDEELLMEYTDIIPLA